MEPQPIGDLITGSAFVAGLELLAQEAGSHASSITVLDVWSEKPTVSVLKEAVVSVLDPLWLFGEGSIVGV